MTLRLRLLLALLPLPIILAILGSIGLILLDRTGGRIDAILKENYVSVQAMHRLNAAASGIDNAFQQTLLASNADASHDAYRDNWKRLDDQFAIEAANITIHPAEDELVVRLMTLRDEYRQAGTKFFAAGNATRRAEIYSGPKGLLALRRQIVTVADEIFRINGENMEAARDEARDTARTALRGFIAGMILVALLVSVVGWYLHRTLLTPIRDVTAAAQAIGAGHLDRRVPVFGVDELGKLADAFNAMSGQLRTYRQTNLARLMRVQRTAQATIDSFPDPVLVLDPAGRVELANTSARGILGVGPAADGRPGPVWEPPPAIVQPLADALQKQQSSAAESFDQAVTFRQDGSDRAYLPHVRSIRDSDGETLGAAVVLYDVTRFRLLDQYKTDLVATVSHELKTPLTSVRLALHVLLEETIGPLTAKQTELLVDARDSSERLLGLIEQLLSMARLQQTQGREQFQPDDPGDLLRRAAAAFAARAEDKHVELVVAADSTLPPVGVDRERMGLALTNLLENAVTYTPAGGKVTLSAIAAADGRIEMSVADTGVGIPAEYLPHVFERFFRIPGQSQPAGTGLGLAIVREIVTAHGGEVVCESEPGRGTIFHIMLPRWDAVS